MNELHFTDQETYTERLCSLPRVTGRLNGRAGSQPVSQSYYQTIPLRPKLHVLLELFKIIFWFKKRQFQWDANQIQQNTASLTVHEYVRNPVLYTANSMKGGFLKQRGHSSDREHFWNFWRDTERETILLVSAQINVRESDKTKMKENQKGQKTVQLKRKFPFDHTKQSLSQCFTWWGILIATALGVITSRYPQISYSLLRNTKKDLVAKQHLTVVFNETDGDHEATISRCSFYGLKLKLKK